MTDLRIPLLPAWMRWAGVALVAAVIFYHSVLTAPPDVPKPEPFSLDKWQHFLAYGALSAAAGYALADHRWGTAAVVATGIGATVAYGVGIEAIQALLPNRYFSFGDALANAIGATVASPLYVLLRRTPLEPALETWTASRLR